MAEEFWELYKHPLWQKKRLEIMSSAEFACEKCGRQERTLNVHHGYYLKDVKPWEYPDWSLHCLCEECHLEAEEDKKISRFLYARLESNFSDEIIGFMLGLELLVWGESARITSEEMADGMGKAWGISGKDIWYEAMDRCTGNVTKSGLELLKSLRV